MSAEIKERVITKEITSEVMTFHKSFIEYEKTPLRGLDNLAGFLGLKTVYVKDESYRFGLNAFKVLGASYAIGKVMAQFLGKEIKETPFDFLTSSEVKDQLKEVELVATTDGNHGRAVAWTGQKLGLKTHIYMPKGSTKTRLSHLLTLGAKAEITEYNYDETIRYMLEQAKGTEAQVIQDTAWEGYDEVPKWIMQGYATMAEEIIGTLKDIAPTHIFLQAGVGAFAGVMAEMFAIIYKEKPPCIIVVEAEEAGCFYDSIKAGKVKAKSGELSTIMAGLACGEPNPIAWDILKNIADYFITATNEIAAKGMRVLGNPIGKDVKITSGESGAVTMGVLSTIMESSLYSELRAALGLNSDSVVILINTEGDTDPEVYRDVVWNGIYPYCE